MNFHLPTIHHVASLELLALELALRAAYACPSNIRAQAEQRVPATYSVAFSGVMIPFLTSIGIRWSSHPSLRKTHTRMRTCMHAYACVSC
jgi:hypothetical protein